LRNELCWLVKQSRIGLVVVPYDARCKLGNEALLCLDKVLRANELDQLCHDVYFDTGIDVGFSARQAFMAGSGRRCDLLLDQDSIRIGGLQLADLAAHYLGTMLLAEMGKITKKVLAGEGSGYSPDLEIELEFELWARLRHSFFCSPRCIVELDNLEAVNADDYILSQTVDVSGYGLYVSQLCDDLLRNAAVARFGTSYLGCIH
jgi:hypothetical protein